MKNLLIDIGNSVIKAASYNLKSSKISNVIRLPYNKLSFEKDFKKFFDLLELKRDYKNIGISSLDKNKNEFIKKFISNNFNQEPVFIDRDLILPIKINYANSIGNDRICNAVAADNICKGKNILIVDFGTATTYTVISKSILEGGIISPGILTAIKSLSDKTTLNKVLPVFPKKLINRDTNNNIKSGILFQTLYFLERVIFEVKKDYKDLKIIATGGFSHLVSKKTKLIDLIDKELIFKGINKILILNEINNK